MCDSILNPSIFCQDSLENQARRALETRLLRSLRASANMSTRRIVFHSGDLNLMVDREICAIIDDNYDRQNTDDSSSVSKPLKRTN